MLALIFLILTGVVLVGIYGIERRDYAVALLAIIAIALFVVGLNL